MPANLEKYVTLALDPAAFRPNNIIYIILSLRLWSSLKSLLRGEATGGYFKALRHAHSQQPQEPVRWDGKHLPPPYGVLLGSNPGLTMHPGKAGNQTTRV